MNAPTVLGDGAARTTRITGGSSARPTSGWNPARSEPHARRWRAAARLRPMTAARMSRRRSQVRGSLRCAKLAGLERVHESAQQVRPLAEQFNGFDRLLEQLLPFLVIELFRDCFSRCRHRYRVPPLYLGAVCSQWRIMQPTESAAVPEVNLN